jgi:hypothetical protein
MGANPITCCSGRHSVSTPRGLLCPQSPKWGGTCRSLARGVLGNFTRNDSIFIVRVNRAQAMIAVSNDDLAMGRIPEQKERG